ncbi:MAG: superoxide dismutase family protein [Planctomycetaceae bacterium]
MQHVLPGIIATALLEAAVLLVPMNQPTQQHPDDHQVDVPKEAVAVLLATKGNDTSGTLMLTQQDDYVHVKGSVHGLTPGEHGFHIHEFGDLRDPSGKSAGGHFNPHGTKHGGPEDKERHPGDLGNITADANGMAKVDKKAKGLKLHFVLGRSFVVHAGKDDLKSQPSGDAGARVAVGVIGFAEVKE